MSLAEIVVRLDQISQVWRSDTSAEQRLDLADLDDLLEQLDEVEHETFSATERIDELRGRIEILMDEIEISLGIEPPVIASEDAGESDEEESEPTRTAQAWSSGSSPLAWRWFRDAPPRGPGVEPLPGLIPQEWNKFADYNWGDLFYSNHFRGPEHESTRRWLPY